MDTSLLDVDIQVGLIACLLHFDSLLGPRVKRTMLATSSTIFENLVCRVKCCPVTWRLTAPNHPSLYTLVYLVGRHPTRKCLEQLCHFETLSAKSSKWTVLIGRKGRLSTLSS